MSNEDSIRQIHEILVALEPDLSTRNTRRFDPLKYALSKLLNVPWEQIYVSTIDKSSNANTRTQQMLIRQEIQWKIFVGVCLSNDMMSTSYDTAARRVFERSVESRTLQDFEAMIWMSKKSGSVARTWSPAKINVRTGSPVIDKVQSIWPDVETNIMSLDHRQRPSQPPMRTDSAELSDLLGWSHDKTSDVLSALEDATPQVILAGPPGTGKTHAARLIASQVIGALGDVNHERIEFVQFHPSYGYEDFIEGLLPQVQDDGTLFFQNAPGVLMRLVQKIGEIGGKHVLIIDEINRANLSKVFGELMFLLEYRDVPVKLKSSEDFLLPSELTIIGTMNTADRSIRGIDLALRRRFDFFEIAPDIDVLRSFYTDARRTNSLGESLFDGFDKLNSELEKLLDRHHKIGHSFFMHEQMDEKALRSIWRQQIFPVIEEYLFDRPENLDQFTLHEFWPNVSD